MKQRSHSIKFMQKCILATSIAMALNTSLYAQEVPGENVVDEDLEKIVVTGVKGSLSRALRQKRQSVGVVDAISAEDLGKFPDLNISESLQRVPGVTLNRNSNGEGQAINLRGLGPQFTRVEINGMSGTGNGSGGRFGTSSGERGFNFELLAAELFSNVEIAKSPSASQVEGGMAGVVSLETPKPLSYEGFKATVSAQGNYSEFTGDTDPRGAILLSQNIDDIFGISFSLALSETSFRSDTAEAGSWRPGSSYGRGDSDALIPNGTRFYNFLENRDTLGSTLTIQYRPSEDLELTFDAIYAGLDSNRLANRNDMPIENPGPVLSLTEQNGVATAGSFIGVQQRVGTNLIVTDEDFSQYTFKGEYTPSDDWLIQPFIGYSKREADRQFDLYSFRLADENGFDPGTVSFDVRGDFVDFGSTETNFTSNPEDLKFNVFILRPSNDQDEELTTQLDFTRYFDADGLNSIDFGFRYADREKSKTQIQTRLLRQSGVDITDVPSLAQASMLLPFDVSGSNAPSMQQAADPQLIQNTFFPNGQPVDGTFVREFANLAASDNWKVQEKTFNAYVQANFEYDDVQFNVGLRLVDTEQTSDGLSAINIFTPTETIIPTSFSSDYRYYLPSFNFKYDVSEEIVFRTTYSQTLTRPNLPNLAPSERVSGIDEGGGNGSKGNPELDPFTADNFDVGVEWYFDDESILSANLFYKDVGGLIDTTSFTEVRTFPRQSDGVLVQGPITFTTFENGVSAEIKGLELAYQQLITESFGVIFNYTYVDSSADFGAEGDVRSTGLPGLSSSSYNASIFYDDGDLDARLSYAWRERYLAAFTDDFGVPRFTDDFGQLDFSANYGVTENLQLQLQVLNITNEQVINQSTALYLPYGVNDLDRRVLFGARYSF
jgi:iron complex outermembrane receptor protein